MTPELVREFVEAFQEEANRLARSQEQERTAARSRLQAAYRKIAALVTAIEDGRYSAALSDRLAALETERERLKAQQIDRPEPPIRLHPRFGEVSAEKVAGLEQVLNDPEFRTEAAGLLRQLIERVELRPGKEGSGLDAILRGTWPTFLCSVTRLRATEKPRSLGLRG